MRKTPSEHYRHMLKYEFHSSEECLLIQEVKKKKSFFTIRFGQTPCFNPPSMARIPITIQWKTWTWKKKKNESKKSAPLNSEYSRIITRNNLISFLWEQNFWCMYLLYRVGCYISEHHFLILDKMNDEGDQKRRQQLF